MNAVERSAVLRLVRAFSILQPAQKLREELASAIQSMDYAEATQVLDMYGHVETLRGPEVIIARNAELFPLLKREYTHYLKEHPLIQKWDEVLQERSNSVATMSERTSSKGWGQCGFRNELCVKKANLYDVAGIHLLGLNGQVRFGMYLCLTKSDRFQDRHRSFFKWLAPYLSRGLSNNLYWDALASEATALEAGFETCKDAIATVQNKRVGVASPGARKALGLEDSRNARTGELDDFVRAASVARITDSAVLWRNAKGEVYQLQTLIGSNGTLVVRMIPRKIEAPGSSAWLDCALRCGLAQRQSEIIKWLAMGLADKQIASELSCSVHTVRAHLRSVYETLGVDGRIAALNKIRSMLGGNE